MRRYVFDIEIFKNFFLIIFWSYPEKEQFVFEISERRNDYEHIKKFMSQKDLYLIGFNSKHFDNLLLQKLLTDKYRDWQTTVSGLKQLTDWIITDYDNRYEQFKWYQWKQSWQSVDLFMYWSQLTRRSKKISLKTLAVNIHHPWIQELPIHPNEEVKDYDEVIKYCHNDVDITYKLCDLLKEQIAFRLEVEDEHKIKCLSADGVKIGTEYLAKLYSNTTGIDMKEVKGHKTFRNTVRPKEFLPNLDFNHPESLAYYNYLLNYDGKP